MLGWLKRRRAKKASSDSDPMWGAAPFRSLERADRELMEERLVRRTVAAGETLLKEGEPAHDVFVIVSGTFEVVRGDAVLREVGPGDTIGESALFEGLPRRATVLCTVDAEVVALPLRDLHRDAAKKPKLQHAYQRVVLSLAEQLADKLEAQTDAYVEGTRQREVMGAFVVNLLILLCGYVFLLSALQNFGTGFLANTSVVSIPIQLVFASGSWWFIRSTGRPWSEFGLGFKHLIGSVVEAAVLTPVVLVVITGLKKMWLLARDDPSPLIEHPDFVARLTSEEVVPLLTIYALSSAVQELIVRGALQSSLESFLAGDNSKRHAIVVSGLLFSVTHLHMSFLFAALVLLPGMFWGWLFARRRNLLGVTLSHIVVGAFVFFILGIKL